MQRIRKRMAQVEISDSQTCRFAVEPQYKKQAAENSGESKKRNQHVEDIPPAKRKKKQKEIL